MQRCCNEEFAIMINACVPYSFIRRCAYSPIAYKISDAASVCSSPYTQQTARHTMLAMLTQLLSVALAFMVHHHMATTSCLLRFLPFDILRIALAFNVMFGYFMRYRSRSHPLGCGAKPKRAVPSPQVEVKAGSKRSRSSRRRCKKRYQSISHSSSSSALHLSSLSRLINSGWAVLRMHSARRFSTSNLAPSPRRLTVGRRKHH